MNEDKNKDVDIDVKNSYNNIVNFFNTNSDIEPFYKKTKQECFDSNCYSSSTMIILTIEKLFEEISNLKDDIEFNKVNNNLSNSFLLELKKCKQEFQESNKDFSLLLTEYWGMLLLGQKLNIITFEEAQNLIGEFSINKFNLK